jgi:hypothetical protein
MRALPPPGLSRPDFGDPTMRAAVDIGDGDVQRLVEKTNVTENKGNEGITRSNNHPIKRSG